MAARGAFAFARVLRRDGDREMIERVDDATRPRGMMMMMMHG